MVHLYVKDLDVHFVEWNCPQDCKLRALDVEAEVVHGGVAQGQEDGVQGEALSMGYRCCNICLHRYFSELQIELSCNRNCWLQ